MSKDLDFCQLQKMYLTNMESNLLDTATKTGLDALQIASKKVAHKASEATGESKSLIKF